MPLNARRKLSVRIVDGLRRLYREHKAEPATLAERFPQYEFGRGSYGSDLQVRDFGEGTTLTVGSFCSIAAGVTILLGGNHRADWVTTYPFPEFPEAWPAARAISGHPATRGNVNIGNDVWIGTGAVILSGVTIEDGAIVGAHSLVSRNVRAYAVVVGNPAREVRRRFDEKTIGQLLELRWWSWSDEKISRILPLLLANDVDALIRAGTD